MLEVNGTVPRSLRGEQAKMPVLNCWTKLLPPTTQTSLSLLDLFTGQFIFQVMAPYLFLVQQRRHTAYSGMLLMHDAMMQQFDLEAQKNHFNTG